MVSKFIENINGVRSDITEIMPSRVPEIINLINHSVEIPVIAGGLVKNKEHIQNALDAGAIAVASGTPALWGEKI